MNDMVEALRAGEIAIIRTDTLYGIVARAANQAAVEKIFEIKQRDRDKPLIVLLADADDAYDGAQTIRRYSENVDEPVTIIVDSPHAPVWLRHRDGTVGYRVPRDKNLRDLLRQTGPLVAPSANPQGEQPVRTIGQAKNYFGDEVAWYLDGGEVPIDQLPSRIIRLHADGSTEQLR